MSNTTLPRSDFETEESDILDRLDRGLDLHTIAQTMENNPIFFRYLVQHTNREKSTPLIAVRVSLQGVEVHRLEWSIGHLKITSEKISTQNKWNNSFLEISFAIISSQASLSPVKASWWLCLLEKQPTGPAFKKKTPCLWKNEWILF